MMARIPGISGLAILGILGLVSIASLMNIASQTVAAAQPAARKRPTFSVRTDAIRVDVLVTRDNHPVTGLTADDFDLSDDGVPQKVRLIDQGEIPLDVVLALDLSGSMQGEPLRQVVSGVRSLIDTLRPDDRVSLLTFSHLYDTFIGLTRDREPVRVLLAQSRAGGGTALNDAAYGALLAADPTNRTLVMLFTDGVDSASWLTPSAIVDTARRLDVVVYSVTLEQREPPRGGELFAPEQTAPAPASAFAAGSAARSVTARLPSETGGRELRTDRADRLAGVFRSIVEEFGQRYLLAYEPPASPKPGWHRISVKLKSGRSGRVSARAGYFAASTQAP